MVADGECHDPTVGATTDNRQMRATDGTGHLGHTQPQHVWITTSSGVFPGLLLEWIRDGAAPWQGRVIWAEGSVAHQAVLAAKQISPFDRPGHQAQS